jgi:hypothetical protein
MVVLLGLRLVNKPIPLLVHTLGSRLRESLLFLLLLLAAAVKAKPILVLATQRQVAAED